MLCFGASLRCLFQQGDVEACWEIARSAGEACEVMYCTESALKEWPGKEETTDPVTFNVKSVASRQQHTHHWNTDTHRPEVVKGANTCQNSRSSTQTPLQLCQQQDTKTQLAAGFWHHTDEFIQDKMAARRSSSSVFTQVSARWQCSLLYQRRCLLEGTG